MIALSEIYGYLGSAELSNLFMADEGLGTGVLKPEYHDTINKSIYLGLTDLHTRFDLKIRDFDYVHTGQEQFKLSIPNEDFLEIHQVIKNDKPLYANSFDGYLLLDNHVLSFKSAMLRGDVFKIIYRANHSVITNRTTHIELPRAYLNALLYFIAARVFTSIPNQLDGDLNEGNRYAQKYREEIAMLMAEGLDVDNSEERCLFNERGFV